MAGPTPTLYSPVIGTLFGPSGPNGVPNGAPRSRWDTTILRHLMQSPWDHEFHVAAPITLAANAARSTVVEFGPTGLRAGIVTGVAMGVALLSDFDNIRWAILVDDQPWPGFDNIIGPFGVFVYPKPVLIPLNPDQVCRIVASNLTAVAIPLVTAYLMGRHFPVDSDAQAAQG